MTAKSCALVAVLIWLTLGPTTARAQTTPATTQPAPESHTSILESTVLFLAGGASGLVIHESGHLVWSATFDANPRVLPLKYGFIPFFRIDHTPVTRRQEFVISSAGFWMQYLDSEWILTAQPDLRHANQPFLKGILAFDLGASAVYSIAAFGKFGPVERDTHGMAVSLGHDGWPEPVLGVFVLTPAVLDGYRYFHPDSTWAKWASRSAKIASVALVAAAGLSR